METCSRLALCALIGLTAGGCESQEGTNPAEPPQVQAETQAVSFDEVEGATSYLSGIVDRRRLVIEDSGAWSDFWAELQANLAPRPKLPAVDFDARAVVAATMGQRSTGGYAIRIEDITREGGRTRVVVVETSPGAACLTSQAFTAPATAVTVSLPIGEVEFIERTEKNDCS